MDNLHIKIFPRWSLLTLHSSQVSRLNAIRLQVTSKLHFNGTSPASFSFIFGLFQGNIDANFTTNQCEKSSPSIRSRDSNPRPSDSESHPITTRPGLPPLAICYPPISYASYYHYSQQTSSVTNGQTIFHNLTICNNQNLPNSIKMCQNRL